MQFPRGPVTNVLAVINLVIAAILLVPSWWQYAVISGGLVPIRLSSGSAAFPDIGFMVPAFLTPLSAAFLHGGVAHVVMNMLMLLLIGKLVVHTPTDDREVVPLWIEELWVVVPAIG